MANNSEMPGQRFTGMMSEEEQQQLARQLRVTRPGFSASGVGARQRSIQGLGIATSTPRMGTQMPMGTPQYDFGVGERGGVGAAVQEGGWRFDQGMDTWRGIDGQRGTPVRTPQDVMMAAMQRGRPSDINTMGQQPRHNAVVSNQDDADGDGFAVPGVDDNGGSQGGEQPDADEGSGNEDDAARAPAPHASGGYVPAATAIATMAGRPPVTTAPTATAPAQQNPNNLLFTSLYEARSVNNLMRRDALAQRVLRKDDWRTVQANKAYYVDQYKRALQHTGFKELPKTRKTIDAQRHKITIALAPEEIANWKRWFESQAEIVDAIHACPDQDNETELRAYEVVEEMLMVHQHGIKVTAQSKDRSLTCTERVNDGLRVLREYPIVRHRILDGDRISDFCASPDAYAAARTRNLEGNFNRRGGGKENLAGVGTKSGLAKDGPSAVMKRRMTGAQLKEIATKNKAAKTTTASQTPTVSQADGVAAQGVLSTMAPGVGGIAAENSAQLESTTQDPVNDMRNHDLREDETAGIDQHSSSGHAHSNAYDPHTAGVRQINSAQLSHGLTAWDGFSDMRQMDWPETHHMAPPMATQYPDTFNNPDYSQQYDYGSSGTATVSSNLPYPSTPGTGGSYGYGMSLNPAGTGYVVPQNYLLNSASAQPDQQFFTPPSQQMQGQPRLNGDDEGFSIGGGPSAGRKRLRRE